MALTETLVDDFTSGTINGTKWPTVSSGISVVSGRLQLVDSTGAYPSANSASSYDIRNSYALAQVTPAPRSGGNSQQTYFMFYASTGNGFGLAVGDTTLYKVTVVGGSETDTSIATYNATTHAWWRIRHNGTNIVLGWSSDGLSWTEGTPFAPGVTLGTTGFLALSTGRYTSGDTATAYFDNVNITSTPKSDADTGTGTDSAGTRVGQYTGTDTGTGTENPGAVLTITPQTGSETSTGADSSGALTTSATSTETATGTDSHALTTSPTSTDTSTGTDAAGRIGLVSAEAANAALDSAGTIAVTVSSTETATGAESVPARATSSEDTATATDAPGAAVANPSFGADTVTAVDADHLLRPATGAGDTFTVIEAVTGRRLEGTEVPTVVEVGTAANLAAVDKTGSETVTCAEGQAVALPGAFTQIPSPKVWANGDSLDHGTLNKEWRDTFLWLLRKTSPGISVYNGDGAALTFTNNVAIPLKTEEFKRGNLTHATNDTKVYVWEPGWYLGYCQVGAAYNSVSGDGLKPASVVKVNGIIASRAQTTRDTNNVAIMEHQFSLYLNAGDYVEIAIGNDWSGTLTSYTSAYGYPFLSLWWRSN